MHILNYYVIFYLYYSCLPSEILKLKLKGGLKMA